MKKSSKHLHQENHNKDFNLVDSLQSSNQEQSSNEVSRQEDSRLLIINLLNLITRGSRGRALSSQNLPSSGMTSILSLTSAWR